MSTAEHSAHAGRVRTMFGRIAGRYDFLNHFLSLGLDVVWRRRMVRTVRPLVTGRFLDLAAGTMDVALELRRQHPGCSVLAMDFALPMLRRGAAKLGGHRRGVQPVQADGRALPLPDACVDAVTIAFGIRNILPRQAAYAEMLRVLAPGGRLCILEFGSASRPIWKGVYNFYLDRLLPLAGRVISGDATAYRYLADTIRAFPSAEGLADELRAAGFTGVAHSPLSGGIVTIHVAEKPASPGGTFVVGASRAKAPAGPAQAPVPETSAPEISAPAAGNAALRAAANVQAGLGALEALAAQAPTPKTRAKAPAAMAGAARPKAAKSKKAAPAKAETALEAEPKPKAKATAPEAKAPAKPKAKPAPKPKTDTAGKAGPKAPAKPKAKPRTAAETKAPKAPAKGKKKTP
jgi:demethylmenaquinone methyltransferase/2-methoxy-6-polyprenyl-1,4-benzoquinol methylase